MPALLVLLKLVATSMRELERDTESIQTNVHSTTQTKRLWLVLDFDFGDGDWNSLCK